MVRISKYKDAQTTSNEQRSNLMSYYRMLGSCFMSRKHCPSCKAKISWTEKRKLIRGFCLRRASPCPHCGIMLLWSKWPWRVMNFGIHLGIIYCFFVFVNIEFNNVLHIIGWIALLFGVAGLLALKLEVFDSGQK